MQSLIPDILLCLLRVSFITITDLVSVMCVSKFYSKSAPLMIEGLELTVPTTLSKLEVLFSGRSKLPILSGLLIIEDLAEEGPWPEFSYHHLTIWSKVSKGHSFFVPLLIQGAEDPRKTLMIYDDGYRADLQAKEGYLSFKAAQACSVNGYRPTKIMVRNSEDMGSHHAYPLHTYKAVWIRDNANEVFSVDGLTNSPNLEYIKADHPIYINSGTLLSWPKLKELGPFILAYRRDIYSDEDNKSKLDHPSLTNLNVHANMECDVSWALKQGLEVTLYGKKDLLPLYQLWYGKKERVKALLPLD